MRNPGVTALKGKNEFVGGKANHCGLIARVLEVFRER